MWTQSLSLENDRTHNCLELSGKFYWQDLLSLNLTQSLLCGKNPKEHLQYVNNNKMIIVKVVCNCNNISIIAQGWQRDSESRGDCCQDRPLEFNPRDHMWLFDLHVHAL